MKFAFFLSIGILIGATIAPSYSQQKQTTTTEALPQVALLGVFHFGATNDLASMKMVGTLEEPRQSEIKTLVAALATYRPTKILVEYPFAEIDTLNKRYNSYLKGEFDLKVNEIYQIGFRLAKTLKHPKLYGIDYKLDLPFDPIMAFCEKNNQMPKIQEFITNIQSYVANENELLNNTTLSEYFIHMNSDEADKFSRRVYLQNTMEFGTYGEEVGTDFTNAWYKRNLIMMNYIARTLESPNERVLVIVGASHRAMIRPFLEDRNDLEYVEIANFLK